MNKGNLAILLAGITLVIQLILGYIGYFDVIDPILDNSFELWVFIILWVLFSFFMGISINVKHNTDNEIKSEVDNATVMEVKLGIIQKGNKAMIPLITSGVNLENIPSNIRELLVQAGHNLEECNNQIDEEFKKYEVDCGEYWN